MPSAPSAATAVPRLEAGPCDDRTAAGEGVAGLYLRPGQRGALRGPFLGRSKKKKKTSSRPTASRTAASDTVEANERSDLCGRSAQLRRQAPRSLSDLGCGELRLHHNQPAKIAGLAVWPPGSKEPGPSDDGIRPVTNAPIWATKRLSSAISLRTPAQRRPKGQAPLWPWRRQWDATGRGQWRSTGPSLCVQVGPCSTISTSAGRSIPGCCDPAAANRGDRPSLLSPPQGPWWPKPDLDGRG